MTEELEADILADFGDSINDGDVHLAHGIWLAFPDLRPLMAVELQLRLVFRTGRASQDLHAVIRRVG